MAAGLQWAQVASKSLYPRAYATRHKGITMMVVSLISYAAEQPRCRFQCRMSQICSGLINVPGTDCADGTVSCLTLPSQAYEAITGVP